MKLSPGLMLVHGNRPETLRDLLVTWMKRYPLGPLENEVILVQSNGIAQWLKLALDRCAHQRELCANKTWAAPKEARS
ncbi:MAG: exodeoxyribonuclease V subunit gamma [Methylococcus sp.]